MLGVDIDSRRRMNDLVHGKKVNPNKRKKRDTDSDVSDGVQLEQYPVDHVATIAMNMRESLGLDAGDEPSVEWIASNRDKVVNFIVNTASPRLKEIGDIIRERIESGEKCAVRSRTFKHISVLPVASMTPHFLHLDVMAFDGIVREIYAARRRRKSVENKGKPEDEEDEEEPKENEGKPEDDKERDPEAWSVIFNSPEKLLTKAQRQRGYFFTGTVDTDGISVSFHFRRPKFEDELRQEEGTKEKKEASKAKKRKRESEHLSDEPVETDKSQSGPSSSRPSPSVCISETNGDEDDRDVATRHAISVAMGRSENDRVVAIDPGRSNIIFGVERIRNTDDPGGPSAWIKKPWKFTRGQFEHEGYIKRSRHLHAEWNKPIQSMLDALSLTSKRDPSFDGFRRYALCVKEHFAKIADNYATPEMKRLRFTLYSKKRSTVSRAVSRILRGTSKTDKGRRLIVAYGDGRFASTGRGESGVPVKTIRREFEKQLRRMNNGSTLVSIDEWGTSKILAKRFMLDENDENEDRRTAPVRGVVVDQTKVPVDVGKGVREVRGLVWHGTANNRGFFIDRDLNGASNILELFESLIQVPSRPSRFVNNHKAVERLPAVVVYKMIGRNS